MDKHSFGFHRDQCTERNKNCTVSHCGCTSESTGNSILFKNRWLIPILPDSIGFE